MPSSATFLYFTINHFTPLISLQELFLIVGMFFILRLDSVLDM